MKFKTLAFLIKINFYFNENKLIFSLDKFKEINVDKLEVIEVNSTIIDKLDILSEFVEPLVLESIKIKVKEGQACFIGIYDGECVFRSLVLAGPKKIKLNYFNSFNVNKNEIYIHYCETHSEYRGLNIYPSVLSAICKKYNENFKVLIAVDNSNIASIRGVEKVGFVEFRSIITRSFFFIKYLK